MPLNRRNTKNNARVHRGGVNIQKITLYKRGDNQKQGVVVAHELFTCWRDLITVTGQTLVTARAVNVRTTWHIPRAELNRNGILTVNATDKIYDPLEGIWWTPYASTTITESMFGNMVAIDCYRTDPL